MKNFKVLLMSMAICSLQSLPFGVQYVAAGEGQDAHDQAFQCTVCQKNLGNKRALQFHMRAVHTFRQCPVCQKNIKVNGVVAQVRSRNPEFPFYLEYLV